MSRKITLTATVNVVKVVKVGGKAGFLSHVLITGGGNLIVASGKLAGKYTPEQALAAFRKDHSKFQLTPAVASLSPAALAGLKAA